MLSLTLVVAVGLAIVVCVSVAGRTGIAAPVLFLVAGVGLGFVPALRAVQMPPEAVLLVFLPILLYWESFTSSLQQIRGNLRLITLLSTVLVGATAAAVAVTAHAAGQEHLSVGHVGGLFLLSYLGGGLIGYVAAGIGLQVRRRLDDPFQHNVLALVTPLAAYLVAEFADVSGVLAVVVSGLTISRAAPRLFGAQVRQYVGTVMGFVTDLANATLFVLIGLQAQNVVRDLDSIGVRRALVIVVLVSGAVIGTRFLWLFTSPYVIRALDRRPYQKTLRMGPRARTVMSLAGFRGAVSLAAALSVPHVPGCDVVVFVTAGVIGVTLLVQAPLLPRVVRWAELDRERLPLR